MTQLPFPLIALLLLALPISVISQSDSELSTLLSLKKHWGDLPAFSSWNPATSPCSWDGIQCSPSSSAAAADGGATRVVTGISLFNANITTQIPASICELKNLTTLDLSWNFIPDTFPTVLYNCSALTYLDLSMNCFVGSIPDDIDKLSSSLQLLNLSSNNFSGDIPRSIGGLKELRTLNLTYNLLDGTYPSEIANLSKLEYLVMPYNPFTPMALPSDWGRLNKLKFIFMRQCNLMGEIPESFGGLESLEHLDLVDNGLEGTIPNGLFLLKNLSYLYLYKNHLSGEIPSSVQALNLVEIDLSDNNLNGSIPRDFGKLKRLRLLSLFSNQFFGEIPTSIGFLPELEQLKLFSNKLSGTLPSELGLHSRFVTLEIEDNQFSGSLPENLCSKGTLTDIRAFANNLSGEIPKSLENCTSLRTLELYNNSFTGEIPSRVWNLPNLYSLRLSFNGFTGCLSNQVAKNMTFLEAGNNILSGDLPLGLTSLSRLIRLSLEGNQLSGELPMKINSWKSLGILNLARNKFSGPIPSALGSLPRLINLDLSSNDLSGEIPDELEKLPYSFLNLSNTKLSGEVPYLLDTAAYANSFFNTYLCRSNKGQIFTLPRCSASSSSSPKHLSPKLLAMILVIAVIVFLVILYFTVFVLREMRQRRHKNELTSWKLTSFQRLEFTEATILSSLSKRNVIGSGGSGEVYRVQVDNSGYSVAVKRIWNKHNLEDAQLLAEVQILGTIRHTNIVKLLCCISSDKSMLLVFEYLKNQSLDRWLHRRRRLELECRGEVLDALDWPTRMRIAIGAAQGLCYMHHDCSPPIIHRDVKSSNILLDYEFNAKIADFGIAKMIRRQGELYTMSNVVGTFGYFPPEYRYTKKVNEKVDVYSFGVVLLELVTGKEPNNGDVDETLNLAQWSWRHWCEEKPIIDALDEEVMQPCEEMVNVFMLGLMCTHPEPTSRPSMKVVLQVLRQCRQFKETGDVRTEHDVAPLLWSDNMGGSRRAVEDVLDMV